MPPYLAFIMAAERALLERTLPTLIAWYKKIPDRNTKARDICYLPNFILDYILIHQKFQVEAKAQTGVVTYDAQELEKYKDYREGSVQNNNEV